MELHHQGHRILVKEILMLQGQPHQLAGDLMDHQHRQTRVCPECWGAGLLPRHARAMMVRSGQERDGASQRHALAC